MKREEELVAAYLAHCGCSDIVYEPDGNIPPDFLVNGHVAVEVRRLNQNFCTEDRYEGVEETAIPTYHRIKAVASEFGPPTGDASYFLNYTISRPLENSRTLLPKLRNTLEAFRRGYYEEDIEIAVGRGLVVDFFRASKLHTTMFLVGAWSDWETGGFVVSEMAENLKICIEEKSAKIKTVASKYPQWWLVLVDMISYGFLNVDEQDQLRKYVERPNCWDKIIIVNSENYAQAFEL